MSKRMEANLDRLKAAVEDMLKARAEYREWYDTQTPRSRSTQPKTEQQLRFAWGRKQRAVLRAAVVLATGEEDPDG